MCEGSLSSEHFLKLEHISFILTFFSTQCSVLYSVDSEHMFVGWLDLLYFNICELIIKNINQLILFLNTYFLKSISKMYTFSFSFSVFWGEIVRSKPWVIFDVEKKASPCKEAILRICNENKINRLILGSQHCGSWWLRIPSLASTEESVSLKNKAHLLCETVYSLSKGCIKVFNKSCCIQPRDEKAQLPQIKYIRNTRKTQVLILNIDPLSP